jgi:hypothetical protein
MGGRCERTAPGPQGLVNGAHALALDGLVNGAHAPAPDGLVNGAHALAPDAQHHGLPAPAPGGPAAAATVMPRRTLPSPPATKRSIARRIAAWA